MDCGARRAARQLHRAPRLGRELRRGRAAAARSPAAHAARDARRRAHGCRAHGAHGARQHVGGCRRRSRVARRGQALHVGERARWVAEAVQRLARWLRDSSAHHGRIRPAESRLGLRGAVRRRRRQRGGVDLLHGVAGCADAALSLSLAARWNGERRACDAGGGGWDASVSGGAGRAVRAAHVLDVHIAAGVRDRAAAEPCGGADAGGQCGAARASRVARAREGAIPARAHARRHAARCVGDDAAGLRSGEEVSGVVQRVRRAGGADGDRRVARRRLSVASDADAAGLHRGEHRQSRHAGAARARVAAQHLRRDRRAVERGSGGRRARAREAAAVRGLDARGVCGGGAAAGRRR